MGQEVEMVRAGLIGSAIAVAVMAIITIVGFVELPADARIPIHWDIHGEADGFAGRTLGLLLVPGLTIFFAAFFALLPKLDPRRKNLEKSWRLYLTGWFGLLLVFASVHLYIVWTAITGDTLPMMVVVIVLGVFFGLVGLVLPHSQPNFFAGLRTPWTLSSSRSWEVTHLWTGRLFMVAGTLAVVVGLAWSAAAGIIALLGGLAAAVTAGAVISYRVWRNDPDAGGY